MAVEAGVDTGGIYAEDATVIGDEETAEELRARLVAMGCRLLQQHLGDGLGGLPAPRDQVGSPSYAEKIEPAELQIRWQQPVTQIRRLIRLGRAWTTFRGRRLHLQRATGVDEDGPDPVGGGAGGVVGGLPGQLDGTEVITGDGSRLRLITVQPEGKRAMAAADWLNGVRPADSERLGG
jgi:methionyl-tRNA formyltransferase